MEEPIPNKKFDKYDKYEQTIYEALNQPNLERAIFLEGVIHLEWIINSILAYYFCVHSPEKRTKFERHLLDDLSYNKKITILRKSEIIPQELYLELKNIGENRNLAAHSSIIQCDLINGKLGWLDKKQIVELTPESVEKYKKKVAKCYAHLASKFDAIISNIENLGTSNKAE